MNYAHWGSEQDLKKVTIPVSLNSKIEKSGLPMGYDQTSMFINTSESHSLIIGAGGSGKTQAITLPMLKMSMLSGDSFVIHDVKGELYSQISTSLKENGYQLIVLDYQEKKYGNNWNPLSLPYELYQSGNKDEAIELLNRIAYYLFYDENEMNNNDPFWITTCQDYFVGLAIYLFDFAKKEEINLNSIFSLSSETTYLKDKVALLPKSSKIYMNLASTVLAPAETKGSILAVFNQKMKSYVVNEKLSKMLSITDFDFSQLKTQRTAIFVVGGHKLESHHLIPLFIDQLFYILNTKESNKEDHFFNIILDEFESLIPFYDFATILTDARGHKIRFILLVNSLLSLAHTYSKEETQMMQLYIGNLVYLFANDFYTLQEVSTQCGKYWNENLKQEMPLISIEELKTLSPFETIILVPRYMPFRSKLLPDYMIPWPVAFSGDSPKLKQDAQVSIYKIQ